MSWLALARRLRNANPETPPPNKPTKPDKTPRGWEAPPPGEVLSGFVGCAGGGGARSRTLGPTSPTEVLSGFVGLSVEGDGENRFSPAPSNCEPPLAARLAALAEAGAAALAERDEDDEAEAFLIRSVRRAEAEGRLPPKPEKEHVALVDGYLAAAGQRPPSWADHDARPSPGSWCSCCGRHRRLGGRWWRPVHPRTDGLGPGPGWRCAVCHPPPPGCEVEEVST